MIMSYSISQQKREITTEDYHEVVKRLLSEERHQFTVNKAGSGFKLPTVPAVYCVYYVGETTRLPIQQNQIIYIGQTGQSCYNRIRRFYRELLDASTLGDGYTYEYVSGLGKIKVKNGHSCAFKMRKFLKPKVKRFGDDELYFPELAISYVLMDNTEQTEKIERGIMKNNLLTPFFNTMYIDRELIDIRNMILNERDYTINKTYNTVFGEEDLFEQYCEMKKRKEVYYDHF